MKKKKIGWQKYEHVLEEQISSSFFVDLCKQFFTNIANDKLENVDLDNELIGEIEESNSEVFSQNIPLALPMNEKMLDEISLITHFDCWVGHTNFDITNDIKNTLDSTDGIEILKIFSRYRFFIGVGKMFNFKDVRRNIESKLLK